MTEIRNPWTNLTHIGVVARNLDEAVKRYEEMGAGPFKKFRLPDDQFNVKWRQHFGKSADDHVQLVAWGQMGPIAVEIFENVKGDSLQKHFLETRGEGVWHYGYDVENMAETIEFMRQRGIGIVGEAEYADGTRMVYFDTLGLGGVYWQAHEISHGSDLKANLGAK